MPGPDRYHRQTLLDGFDAEAQQRLSVSHAVIVGLGAVGCPAADLLVRAGVGRVTLIDRDIVELTNLHRQTLFTEADADEAMPKAEAARARLAAVNSEIRIVSRIADVSARNAEKLIEELSPDCLVDGSDNFDTRYLLNDLAVKAATPLAYAGAVGWRMMSMAVLPGGPCLRCVFGDAPRERGETCDTVGVHGPAATIAGASAASLAIRVLGKLDEQPGTLASGSLEIGAFRSMPIEGSRDPDCLCCGLGRFEFLESSGSELSALCGTDAVQVNPGAERDVDLTALAETWGAFDEVNATRFRLRGRIEFPCETIELTVFTDGRAIVKGTTDAGRARSIYARYVGA